MCSAVRYTDNRYTVTVGDVSGPLVYKVLITSAGVDICFLPFSFSSISTGGLYIGILIPGCLLRLTALRLLPNVTSLVYIYHESADKSSTDSIRRTKQKLNKLILTHENIRDAHNNREMIDTRTNLDTFDRMFRTTMYRLQNVYLATNI